MPLLFFRVCEQVEMGLAASNIVLTGGNMNLPQIQIRFENELRPFVPDMYSMQVYKPDFPELYAWKGAARFVRDHVGAYGANSLDRCMVTRAEYLENGHYRCNEKFERLYT